MPSSVNNYGFDVLVSSMSHVDYLFGSCCLLVIVDVLSPALITENAIATDANDTSAAVTNIKL